MMTSMENNYNEKFQEALRSRLNDSTWSMKTAQNISVKRNTARRRKYFSVSAGMAAAAAVVLMLTFGINENKTAEPVFENFIADQVNKTYIKAVRSEMIVKSDINLSDSVLSNETDLLISETLTIR